jgi:hypothetical protein
MRCIQTWQILNGFVNRQLRFIRVNFGCQLDVTVAHQFHGEPLRHAIALQVGCPGVAQRVKIRVATRFIPVGNSVALQVFPQPQGAWNALWKNQTVRLPSDWPMRGQYLSNFRHQLHRLLFLVFGNAITHHDERNRAVQVNITPVRLLQFLLPQSRSSGSKINDAPIFRACHQLAQLLIRQGPTHTHLFAAPIGPGDVLQRVARDSADPFHPVHQ